LVPGSSCRRDNGGDDWICCHADVGIYATAVGWTRDEIDLRDCFRRRTTGHRHLLRAVVHQIDDAQEQSFVQTRVVANGAVIRLRFCRHRPSCFGLLPIEGARHRRGSSDVHCPSTVKYDPGRHALVHRWNIWIDRASVDD
jgi:hypothetical protein